jgi:hypothetical protein
MTVNQFQEQYIVKLGNLSTQFQSAIQGSSTPLIEESPLLTTYGQLMNIVKITNDYFEEQNNALGADQFVNEQVSKWCKKLDGYLPVVAGDLQIVLQQQNNAMSSELINDLTNKPSM